MLSFEVLKFEIPLKMRIHSNQVDGRCLLALPKDLGTSSPNYCRYRVFLFLRFEAISGKNIFESINASFSKCFLIQFPVFTYLLLHDFQTILPKILQISRA